MRTVTTEIGAILHGSISEITQRSIFKRMGSLAGLPVERLSAEQRQAALAELETSIRLFARGDAGGLLAACARALGAGPSSTALGLGGSPGAAPAAGAANPAARAAAAKRLPNEQEKDIAAARLEAWSEAVRLGLSKFKSVKVATAVSELARNIVFYAGTGTIEIRSSDGAAGPGLEIVARDQGPGIDAAKLEQVFAGTYRSERGMGKGLAAVKKLADEFHLDTGPGRGTTVTCAFRGER